METSLPEPQSLFSPTQSPTITSTAIPTNALPRITTGTDQTYRDRAALVCARAGLTDPFIMLLAQERLQASSPDSAPIPISSITAEHQRPANTLRFDRKLAQNAFIVEAGDFAAVACWEPPESSVYEAAEIWGDMDVGRVIPHSDRRPIFMDFLRQIAEAKRTTFPRNQRYWHLSLMARDPERKDKGAVRAIIEPYVAQARREGMPVWLEAGNERARDVYTWVGGFRVIGKILSGVGKFESNGTRKVGGEGVATWLMIANWPVAEVRN